MAQNQSDKENIPTGRKHGKIGSGGGSFFKRRTARRAKSLGKDHWDDVIFGGFDGCLVYQAVFWVLIGGAQCDFAVL